jgi:hypothetical protein
VPCPGAAQEQKKIMCFVHCRFNAINIKKIKDVKGSKTSRRVPKMDQRGIQQGLRMKEVKSQAME